ncbi:MULTISPECIES: terminase small subunit [Clostridium]
MKLTPKQKIFCDEYLVDLNATRAYKTAYKNIKKMKLQMQ